MKLKVSIGNSRMDKKWRATEMELDEFRDRIFQTKVTAETIAEFKKMPKAQQDAIKDIGGFVLGTLKGGRRKKDCVLTRSALSLDMDYASSEVIEQVEMFFSFRCYFYSTHKHTPEAPRLRLIIPLSREVGPDEYMAVARKVAEEIGIEQFDDTTYEPSRLMYWPSTSSDGEFVAQEIDGDILDPDTILAKYTDWHNTAEWSVSRRQQTIVQREIKKQADPLTKAGMVGAFCRAYTITAAIDTFIPDVYKHSSMPGRYDYIPADSHAGVVIYDDCFAYSHHATDPACGKLLNAFDVVRLHKFGALDSNIALNKISGEWNEQLLADLLVDLQDAQFNLDLTGFEAPEIDQLFSKLHNKDIEEDNFDVEEELKNPALSQAGDIWTLGRHRVICGDSTLPETFKLLMEGKKANLVLTDPPYNVNVEETAGKIKNDNMPDADFYNFLFCAFANMEQNMEQDASIYVFHADTQGLTFRRAFADAGFNLSGCCIWKKNALVLGRSPYQWQHEPCLFGWKKGGKHLWYSDRKQTTIWEYDRPKASKDHPTMKPIALMAYPIKNSTMTNCIVLDPFLGSGSTLIACEETGRICYGVELDEKFMDVIVKRYIEQVGSADGVSVQRDGQTLKYEEVANANEQD